MKRKVYQQLLDWKNQRRGEVALLIKGARRIGKSYIVEEFAKHEYESYILLDFAKVGAHIKELFDVYLDDLDTLFLQLEVYANTKLVARKKKGEVAKSLIIFDEIQFCPRARTAIKFLVADGRFDYIETGSLISIKANMTGHQIPSEEHSIEMYPMDFEEFLWALGDEVLMPYIQRCFNTLTPMGLLHRRAMDYFRLYLIVGGMPQVVREWINTKDFAKVDIVKREILELYRNDIHLYAGNQAIKALSIFEEIPSQLQKHEKKFNLSVIKDDARMRDYADAFLWLWDARIVNTCYNSTEPNVGLKLSEDRTMVKCYMGDTGLLISLAFDEKGIVSNELYQKLMTNKLEVNKGMLMENVVAQMLRASGNNLFFFSKYSKENADDRMEIDFLVRKQTVTSRHNISPIEVKSTRRYALSSLDKCLAKYSQHLSTPYVLHTNDIKQENGMVFLPVYMAGLL